MFTFFTCLSFVPDLRRRTSAFSFLYEQGVGGVGLYHSRLEPWAFLLLCLFLFASKIETSIRGLVRKLQHVLVRILSFLFVCNLLAHSSSARCQITEPSCNMIRFITFGTHSVLSVLQNGFVITSQQYPTLFKFVCLAAGIKQPGLYLRAVR